MAFKDRIVNAYKSLFGSPMGASWGIGDPIPSNSLMKFFVNGEAITWTQCQNPWQLKMLYQNCHPLSSIISQKATAFATGELEVLSATTGNYARGEQKKWDKLFNKPNAIQSKKQFLKQLYSYVELYGYCVVLKNYAAGFKDIPVSMWNIPAEMLYFEPLFKPMFQITPDELINRMWLIWEGKRIKLEPENVMFISDSSAIIDPCTLLPQSKVMNLQKPISIIMSEIEAELTLIQKKGAIGIISNKTSDISGSVPLTADEKSTINNQFQNDYGLSRSQAQYILTSANVEWTPIAFDVRQLMLHESYVKAYKDLTDAFGYEWALTAHSDQSTYNNVRTASLNLYQNTIVPEAKGIAEQLTIGLNAEAMGVVFEFDYDDNPAFTQTEKDRGEGRRAINEGLQIEWLNGKITLNEWREQLEEDTVAKPEFDMFKPEYDKYITEQYGVQPQVQSQPTNPTDAAQVSEQP